MGFATHLGPWLLGTVKNTTGTTAGTIRNMGATIVAQTYTAPTAVILATPAAQQMFTLPAGAKILRFGLEVNVTISGSSSLSTPIDNSHEFILGSRTDLPVSYCFLGKLDEFRIWNVARTRANRHHRPMRSGASWAGACCCQIQR